MLNDLNKSMKVAFRISSALIMHEFLMKCSDNVVSIRKRCTSFSLSFFLSFSDCLVLDSNSSVNISCESVEMLMLSIHQVKIRRHSSAIFSWKYANTHIVCGAFIFNPPELDQVVLVDEKGIKNQRQSKLWFNYLHAKAVNSVHYLWDDDFDRIIVSKI